MNEIRYIRFIGENNRFKNFDEFFVCNPKGFFFCKKFWQNSNMMFMHHIYHQYLFMYIRKVTHCISQNSRYPFSQLRSNLSICFTGKLWTKKENIRAVKRTLRFKFECQLKSGSSSLKNNNYSPFALCRTNIIKNADYNSSLPWLRMAPHRRVSARETTFGCDSITRRRREHR